MQKKTSATLDGTTDWEFVFESPDEGIIPLIEAAQSVKTLKATTKAVVDGLFNRLDDVELRKMVLGQLDKIITDRDANTGVDGVQFLIFKKEIKNFLRQIKSVRIKKANEYIDRENLQDIADRRKHDEEEEDIPTGEWNSEDVFAKVFCTIIEKRFECLCADIKENGPAGKLPFVLSPKFAERFIQIVNKYFMSEMCLRAKSIIINANNLVKENREDFIRQEFDEPKNRMALLAMWQETWTKLTVFADAPAQPDKKLKNKKLINEFQEAANQIQRDNKIVGEIRRALTVETGHFLPPQIEDFTLLISLFNLSVTDLSNQIEALYEFTTQEDGVGHSLSNYSEPENLDLALLAVCYKFPGKFLEEGALKAMLEFADDNTRELKYQLVSRYLSDFI